MAWHYLSSNSRHGTHSPFVYKLADKVIYNNSSTAVSLKGGDKSDHLIQEVVAYLQSVSTVPMAIEKLDLKDSCFEVSEILEIQNSSQVVILKNIYKTRGSKQLWANLLANTNIIVTIDLFHFGVLIRRTEQPKENFKLRFPYSKY